MKFLKTFLWYIKTFPLVCIYYISKLWPRSKNLWCFTEGQNSFYLFLQMQEKKNTPKCYLLISNKKKVDILCSSLKNVCYIYSLKGLLIQLRASVICLTHAMPSPVSLGLMGGATKFNLWHGIGIKNMGALNLIKDQDSWFKIKKWYKYLNVGYLSASPDVLLATSYSTSIWLSKCFNISEENVIISGYPRLDILRSKVFRDYIKLPCCKNYRYLIKQILKYNKRILYMPTWRESNPDYFNNLEFDLDRLNTLMKSKNEIFIFKFHPYTKINIKIDKQYENIMFLSSEVDVYPIIKTIDVLITDYSSIYYDYLLLGNKEIILFPFDEKKYVSDQRGLYFEYKENTPGTRVYSFNELVKVLETNKLNLVTDRDKIIAKFWTSSSKLIDHLEKYHYDLTLLKKETCVHVKN